MVMAMSTGHDGSLSTCHANGALDALRRLEMMVAPGRRRLPLRAVRELVQSAVDLVVHVERRSGWAPPRRRGGRGRATWSWRPCPLAGTAASSPSRGRLARPSTRRRSGRDDGRDRGPVWVTVWSWPSSSAAVCRAAVLAGWHGGGRPPSSPSPPRTRPPGGRRGRRRDVEAGGVVRRPRPRGLRGRRRRSAGRSRRAAGRAAAIADAGPSTGRRADGPMRAMGVPLVVALDQLDRDEPAARSGSSRPRCTSCGRARGAGGHAGGAVAATLRERRAASAGRARPTASRPGCRPVLTLAAGRLRGLVLSPSTTAPSASCWPVGRDGCASSAGSDSRGTGGGGCGRIVGSATVTRPRSSPRRRASSSSLVLHRCPAAVAEDPPAAVGAARRGPPGGRAVRRRALAGCPDRRLGRRAVARAGAVAAALVAIAVWPPAASALLAWVRLHRAADGAGHGAATSARSCAALPDAIDLLVAGVGARRAIADPGGRRRWPARPRRRARRVRRGRPAGPAEESAGRRPRRAGRHAAARRAPLALVTRGAAERDGVPIGAGRSSSSRVEARARAPAPGRDRGPRAAGPARLPAGLLHPAVVRLAHPRAGRARRRLDAARRPLSRPAPRHSSGPSPALHPTMHGASPCSASRRTSAKATARMLRATVARPPPSTRSCCSAPPSWRCSSSPGRPPAAARPRSAGSSTG